MAPNILLATVLLLFSNRCLGANILFLEGVNSPSHHVWMRELINSLVQNGHNLTSLSYHGDKEQRQNLTYLHMDTELVDSSIDSYWNFNELNVISRIIAYESNRKKIFKEASETVGFKALLNYPDDFKVDLIIYYQFAHPGFLVFVAKFEYPPIISASAHPVNDITGARYCPVLRSHDNINHVNGFWSRIGHMLSYAVKLTYKKWCLYPNVDLFLKKTLPQSRSIKEIQSSVKLSLVSNHRVFNPVQPLMSSVIPVGGLQITAAKRLVTDLQIIYTRAKEGVIYLSLGSDIQSESIGHLRLTAIIQAFKNLPDYTFLWKLNATHLDLDVPSNVFLRPWLPQNDILADNRTILFMTSCGYSSLLESAWHGVPMLVFPVSKEQKENAALVVKLGIGLELDLKRIERAILKSTILDLVKNPSIRIRAQKMTRYLKDQLESPLDRALFYIENTLRNSDMTFWQTDQMTIFPCVFTHSMDIFLFLLLFSYIILWFFFIVLKLITQRLFSGKTKFKTQ